MRIFLTLAVLIVSILCGCGCAHVNYLSGATSPLDKEFFMSMKDGYECSYPDQENVLFSKGFVVVEGQEYATFAWRDDRGRLNVVLNGKAELPLQRHPSIWITRVGPEILGDDQIWIDDRADPFTWVALEKSPEDPEKIFREIRRLKGIERVNLLAFRR